MSLMTGAALCLFAILGIAAGVNVGLVSMRLPVATGLGTTYAPVVLMLALFVVGSWLLLLFLASLGQRSLHQRLGRLSIALAEKERELLQVKATSLDQSAESLRQAAARLEQQLADMAPLLVEFGNTPAPRAGRMSRAA